MIEWHKVFRIDNWKLIRLPQETKPSWWNSRYSYKEAGYINSDGYIAVRHDGKSYLSHRIIYEMHNGRIPDRKCIDHINGERLDNRITNLRCVDWLDNNKNKAKQLNNSSGDTGIRYCKLTNKWIAYVGVKGRQKWLGRHDERRQALSARKVEEKKQGFHENHNRQSYQSITETTP